MIAQIAQWIVKDLGLKVFSFVLAVLIWFTVYFASQRAAFSPLQLAGLKQQVYANLPVRVVSTTGDVQNVRVNPREVEVTVQGDSRLLEDLRAHHIRVIVDLTGSPAANNLRKTVEVSTPAGVTYVSARPQQVEVIFPAPN